MASEDKLTPDREESPEPPPLPPELRPGAAYQIPAQGSLGLLALGAAGLKAWRQARDAFLVELQERAEGEAEAGDDRAGTGK